MMSSFQPGRRISDAETREWLGGALQQLDVRDKRLLVIIPDDTRTLPMAVLFETICAAFAERVEKLTLLVALGTHQPMDKGSLDRHLGPTRTESPSVEVLQHDWENPETLIHVGSISRGDMEKISQGLIREEIPVRINRHVLENDVVLILGPVLPHELVGFSGGHKYFFPGVSGPEMVDQSHWLGGLITNPRINGRRDNPVRDMIERAAALVPTQRYGVSLVMHGRDLEGIFLGRAAEAWSSAVELSSRTNIVQVERPFDTVISVVPEKYRDLWTGAKCMTNLEPVVADGGRLILYAPHIRRPSLSHGDWHLQLGYHMKDYILAHWERYKHVPKAVLADLMQLRGIGSYSNGVETPRIDVVLATGIPESTCREINLGFRDPDSIRPGELAGRKANGTLVVANAGEKLWRLSERKVTQP